jgi:hypothetical protein
VRARSKDVGHAVTAAYGFEDGTQEVLLEKDRPNPITLILPETPETATISVHVLDGTTQIELARLDDIFQEISPYVILLTRTSPKVGFCTKGQKSPNRMADAAREHFRPGELRRFQIQRVH